MSTPRHQRLIFLYSSRAWKCHGTRWDGVGWDECHTTIGQMANTAACLTLLTDM